MDNKKIIQKICYRLNEVNYFDFQSDEDIKDAMYQMECKLNDSKYNEVIDILLDVIKEMEV